MPSAVAPPSVTKGLGWGTRDVGGTVLRVFAGVKCYGALVGQDLPCLCAAGLRGLRLLGSSTVL